MDDETDAILLLTGRLLAVEILLSLLLRERPADPLIETAAAILDAQRARAHPDDAASFAAGRASLSAIAGRIPN